ncbi:MAG: Sec-independent protein translocase protein TatB [Gammaproteobacteria bacterium]
MDNIGFTELVLLGVIALVVLGPEKLPGAIRTASLWIGRLRRSFNSIKTDIEREIGADEIRRQLRNEAIMDKFKQTKAQVNDAVNTVRKQTEEIRKTVELEAKAIETATAPVTTPKPAAPAAIANDSATSAGSEPVAASAAASNPAAPASAPPASSPASSAPAPEPAATSTDGGKNP